MEKLCKLALGLSLIYSTSVAQFKPNYNKLQNKTGFMENLSSDASTFYNVGTNFFASPFNFTSEDYLFSALVMSATALSSTLDLSVRNQISKTQSLTMDRVTMFGERMGNPQYGTLLGGALYLGGHFIGDKYLRETGQILVEAILFNGIVTQGLKMTFGRSRPGFDDGHYDFSIFEFENEDDNHSFPSGHTSTAFAITTVLSERVNNTYASILLYSLAGLTAYQRVYANRHWFSDTVIGAILGTAIGKKVISLHTDLGDENSSENNLNLSPYVSGNTYGLGMQLNF